MNTNQQPLSHDDALSALEALKSQFDSPEAKPVSKAIEKIINNYEKLVERTRYLSDLVDEYEASEYEAERAENDLP